MRSEFACGKGAGNYHQFSITVRSPEVGLWEVCCRQMPSQPKVPTSFGRASCGSIVPETLREREGLLRNQGSQDGDERWPVLQNLFRR
jgi:hypothetical protein